MTAEISFDLDMHDDMQFVEGTFRLPNGDWQVFTIGPEPSVSSPTPKFGKWASGVAGVSIKWPASLRLNKPSVLEIMSQYFSVTEWKEIHGPDSMQLR